MTASAADAGIHHASLTREESVQLAALFKPLSDPTRAALFGAIAQQESCVHELAESLDMEQSAISHQLRSLRDQALVETRRQGKHIYYSLADTHVRNLYHQAIDHVRHQ